MKNVYVTATTWDYAALVCTEAVDVDPEAPDFLDLILDHERRVGHRARELTGQRDFHVSASIGDRAPTIEEIKSAVDKRRGPDRIILDVS